MVKNQHLIMLFMLSSLFSLAAGIQSPTYWPHFSGDRIVTTLDGPSWDYTMNMDPHFDSMDPSFTPASVALDRKATVPSCSDLVHGGASGYLGPRGVAMYRRTFDHAAGAKIRLQFQSCSFYCKVWINGHLVGDHKAGGYVPFWLDVPAATMKAKDNEIFVLADNRFNATTAPMHTGGDFWHYGGLIRSVEVHSMPTTASGAVYPWRAWVMPSATNIHQPFRAPTAIDITLALMSSASSSPTTTVKFTLDFDGAGSPQKMSATPNANGTIILKNVPVPNPMLWLTTSPTMHTVTVTIDGASLSERFGLRHWGVKTDTDGASRLTINGEIVKLVGWNHHTQWPVTAASPTDAQMDADILLLKQGGANYVRGAHYPQDPRWLDRLDEAGIVMWSETLGPDVKLKNTQDFSKGGFMEYQMQQMQEMLDGAFNHASIMTCVEFFLLCVLHYSNDCDWCIREHHPDIES